MAITDEQHSFAEEVKARLQNEGFRVDSDLRSEKLGFKVREAQMKKVPYMLVVGDREQAQDGVAVRLRSGEDLKTKSVDDFIAMAQEEIKSKK